MKVIPLIQLKLTCKILYIINVSNLILSMNLFQEAIDHCRWKTTLRSVLKDINITYYKNKTFEVILSEIYNICVDVKGIGILTIYDISMAICKYYNIIIDKVYIIGSGPKRAIKLLKIKPKTQKINKINLKYVDIKDVIIAFDSSKYELNEQLRNNTDGDIFETYLCNWQKVIN